MNDEPTYPGMSELLGDGSRVPLVAGPALPIVVGPGALFRDVEIGEEARQVLRCILAYSDASASDAVREGRVDLRQALAIWTLIIDAVRTFDLQLGEDVTPRCLEMLATIAAKRGGEA